MDKTRLQELAGIVTESRDGRYDLGNGWSHEEVTDYEDDNIKTFNTLIGPDGKRHHLHVSPYGGGTSPDDLKTYIAFYEKFGRMPKYGEFAPGNIMKDEDVAKVRQAVETGQLPKRDNVTESANYMSPAHALRLAKELRSQLKTGKMRQAEGTNDALIRVLEKIAAADKRAMADVEQEYPEADRPAFLKPQAY